MVYPSRIYYTEQDKSLMWDRWQKGESLNAIARHFGRSHSSIQGILSRTGGVRPLPRRRSRWSLTLAEREEISRGLSAGHSLRSIASALGRSPSTVSRELHRNGGCRRYRAHAADQAAWDQAKRPKPCKLTLNRPLAMTVARLLRQRWSPRHAPLPASHAEDTRSWPHCWRGVDPPASGRSRGPGRTRPLGRRPAVRQQQQPDRHLGGTSLTLLHAGPGRQQRHQDRHQCPD